MSKTQHILQSDLSFSGEHYLMMDRNVRRRSVYTEASVRYMTPISDFLGTSYQTSVMYNFQIMSIREKVGSYDLL